MNVFLFFLKISLKSLSRRGVFQVINIAGLSIGLAIVLLISLLVFNEQSFDRSFSESRNIYRINSNFIRLRPGETYCVTGNAVGPAMQEAIPEVISSVRTYPGSYVVRIKDHPVRIKMVWADEDFFRLFDTPFLQGTPENVMSKPNTIAISEQMAKTLFGNDNPVGETFLLDNQHLMEVAAVYRDYPANSSFWEYKMIAPLIHSYPDWMHERISWGSLNFETFCLLSEKTDTEYVGVQMRKVVSEATGEDGFYLPALQRLDEIHLHSANYRYSYTSSQSDSGKVNMLLLLAVIILLVACINYMNMSTARAQKRAKEIGVSKTFGAKRFEIINRLLLETGIFTFVSFIFAYILVWVLLPVFNNLLGEQLDFVLSFRPLFLCITLLIWMATTLLAASYPAIYLSGFPPLKAIRQGGFTVGSGHATVRKALSVGQFAVSIVLIVWVLIIQTQINFINNMDLGYNPRNLIGIELYALPEGSDVVALANDYRAESSVEMVARESNFLFYSDGAVLLKDADDPEGSNLRSMGADADFIDLMQMKLIAGRTLPEQTGDSIVQIILNRAAVDYLGMTPDEVIGKRVLAKIGADITEVCGVVENFNFQSLYRTISCFCMHNASFPPKQVLMLRMKEGNLSEQLKTCEQIFKKHFPNEMFEPRFPDLEVEKAYEGERRTGRVAVVFSVLAILVACMGVFGLTAFMAEQRTKEIGIRKVLGAGVGSIVVLFTGSYMKLLLISLLIAIPAAWWVGDRYLQDFAYRISLSWWIFVAAALITIVLTLLTVGWMAIKAATKNPVKAIKSE